jgi:hypothetical protein
MADGKVTDFDAATFVKTTGLLYLIQDEKDYKITIATLLANLPSTLVKFQGNLVLPMNAPQNIANSGIITSTEFLTTITNDGGTHYLNFNDGSHQGQLKLVMAETMTGVSTITSNIKAENVVFSEPGMTVLFMWFNGNWWILGGSAAVTY